MVKVKNNSYKKLLSDTELFNIPDLSDVEEYRTDRKLDDGQFYILNHFSTKPYFPADMPRESTTIDSFSDDISDINFIISVSGNFFLFQNVTKGQMISKKIISFGDHVSLRSNEKQLIIKDVPDAIYDESTDNLYFTFLPSIKSIFPGIEILYRAATDDETSSFLSSSFINLKDDFNYNKVKVANRQRIALANEELERIGSQKDRLFEYINSYVPRLHFTNGKFDIGNEKDLKSLLYGIEQRFYTTPILDEKFIAKSIIPISNET